MEEEDLRDEVFNMKKEIHLVTSENYLLKVKLRKLREELNKKNKQIDCLLDPKKSASIKKIISERGATMILNLRERNGELEKMLQNKDTLIKKLQTENQTIRLYTVKDKIYQANASLLKNYENDITSKCFPNDLNQNKNSSYYLSECTSPRELEYVQEDTEIYATELIQLNQNLEKIKTIHNHVNKDEHETLTKQDLLSMFENFKQITEQNVCNFTLQDFESVQSYLMDMLLEINGLKEVISRLSIEQERTKEMLCYKNSHLEILAKQIKFLKRKSKKLKRKTRSTQITCKNTELLSKDGSFEKYEQGIEEGLNNMYINAKGDMFQNNSRETTVESAIDETDTTDDDADVETESDRR